MALNTKRIELLAAALESGEFEQTGGGLRAKTDQWEGLCCLGVACEVFRRNTGKGNWQWGGGLVNSKRTQASFVVGSERVYGSTRDYDLLPPAVAEWYGFESINPALPVSWLGSGSVSAMTCNDDLKMTFPEIAAGFRGLIGR